MASLQDVVRFLDAELRTAEVPDAEPAMNGLQLENDGSVSRIAAAVDFSAASVAAAIAERADLLIVHHGMHWRGRQQFVGPDYRRLKVAIEGNLAVYSSHIPLDLHPRFGNNVLLAETLGLKPSGTFGRYKGIEIGVQGSSDVATVELFERVREFSATFRTTAVCTTTDGGRRTRRWAIITGAGADAGTLEEARAREVDTLIVGEGPHHSAVQAMEQGIAVIYGGHYATETLGVRAIARHVGQQFDLPDVFADVPTGL